MDDKRSFWDRTIARFRDWGDRGDDKTITVNPDLPDTDLERVRKQVEDCLNGIGGAVSARHRASELGRAYLKLSREGRIRFFRMLAAEYGVDHNAVAKASARLLKSESTDEKRKIEAELRQVLVPRCVELFMQFNSLDRGVKFLVDMRSDLLSMLSDHPELRVLDHDMRELLRSWFDVGFLDMEQITFNSPAALLEKLIEYEAVHEIRSWDDLKNRLDWDRRCFAFFHPRMPEEPLIFVEVALVNGMADNVQALLDEGAPVGDPTEADTAIFYSISNCQAGLAGVGFGDFLIKRVVERMQRKFPNLKTFATLSPIPGFARWLSQAAGEEQQLLTGSEAGIIRAMAQTETVNEGLINLLSVPDWRSDSDLVAALEGPLCQLAARYLVLEKDRRGRPRDPVARFHLNNGARVERINWLGDWSPAGLKASHGLMVNYLYKISDIEKNHEAFREKWRVAAAQKVSRMAKNK